MSRKCASHLDARPLPTKPCSCAALSLQWNLHRFSSAFSDFAERSVPRLLARSIDCLQLLLVADGKGRGIVASLLCCNSLWLSSCSSTLLSALCSSDLLQQRLLCCRRQNRKGLLRRGIWFVPSQKQYTSRGFCTNCTRYPLPRRYAGGVSLRIGGIITTWRLSCLPKAKHVYLLNLVLVARPP